MINSTALSALASTADAGDSMSTGPYMMTHSGRRFYFADPDPASIHLPDIAFALRHLHRYTGHVGPYAVDVHSVNVLRCALDLGADRETARAALMHDAHEAFVGDCSSPLKAMMREVMTWGYGGASPYDVIESRAALAVIVRFGIGPFDEALVAKADRMVTHAEALCFMGEPAKAWATDPWSGFRASGLLQSHDAFAPACVRWGIV